MKILDEHKMPKPPVTINNWMNQNGKWQLVEGKRKTENSLNLRSTKDDEI